MSDKLNPCLCGFSGELLGARDGGFLSLRCPDCGRSAEAFTAQGLVEAWNNQAIWQIERDKFWKTFRNVEIDSLDDLCKFVSHNREYIAMAMSVWPGSNQAKPTTATVDAAALAELREAVAAVDAGTGSMYGVALSARRLLAGGGE